MKRFLLGLNLSDSWNATKIRVAVLELGNLLSEFQKQLIPQMVQKYGAEKTREKLSFFNELLEGFKYQDKLAEAKKETEATDNV